MRPSWARAACYIPASFPGAIIRRSTGTPFMGYAGATYHRAGILQRPVRRAVPHPAAQHRHGPRRSDAGRREGVERRAVGRRGASAGLLDEYVESEPFLVRISAAKRLRDRVEREAVSPVRDEGRHRRTASRESLAADGTGGVSPRLAQTCPLGSAAEPLCPGRRSPRKTPPPGLRAATSGYVEVPCQCLTVQLRTGSTSGLTDTEAREFHSVSSSRASSSSRGDRDRGAHPGVDVASVAARAERLHGAHADGVTLLKSLLA